jgi:hypothetical protein
MVKKNMKIPKGYAEAVNQRTDNTMAIVASGNPELNEKQK